jgi:hypothetical protein
VKVNADENWAHDKNKSWQGAAPHLHCGVAEPGDGQRDRDVVNVVKAKDSEILAGGKTQPVSSQVMEVNVMNKINPGQVLQNQVVDDVNMKLINKDNPGQIMQN